MALFGSKEKVVVTKVRPTVVRTQNVAKEIFSISKSYDVKPEMLDFNILDVQTYTKMDDKDTEWELIATDELYELDDQTALLNEHFQIKQTYEIEIFSKHKDDESVLKDMKLAVGANATKCKVYLSIAAGSKVSYAPSLERELVAEINKRKIRAGILINIFDEMVHDVASKISAHVRVQENVEYQKNETFLIAQGYEPTPTINDALIMHYENNKDVNEKEKIDYSSRGFIQNVKQDEVLIEYMKAKNGKPGRNCRGEFMQPQEPLVTNEVKFSVDDTIKEVDTLDSVQYIATANGYIAFADNTYTIKKEVDVGEISFKTTGSISSGIDSDVNISVTETDAIKDAIGTGMSVEVTEIDIDGNVGSNAKVTAMKATVGGQTHSTAVIRADKLDINVHKGKAFGKNIHITRLEHGEVTGDTVDVTQALGGMIKAKEIDIEICASHVKATASKRIEIQKLQGSENIFTIDPVVKQDAKKGLASNQDDIKDLEDEVKSLDQDIKKYTLLIKEGTAAFLDIKKRLVHYKKNGVKMPESFVKKYKQFQNLQEHLKALQQKHEVKLDQLNLHTTRTASFQDDILDARVINRDRWVGYNEIRFKLIEPKIELVFKPKEGSLEKIFGLVEVDEGEFEIQAMQE
jgi:hypothetical protein